MASCLHRRCRDAGRVRDDADTGKRSGQGQRREQARPGRPLASPDRLYDRDRPYLLWAGEWQSEAGSPLEYHQSFGTHMPAASPVECQRSGGRLGRGVHDRRLVRLRAH